MKLGRQVISLFFLLVALLGLPKPQAQALQAPFHALRQTVQILSAQAPVPAPEPTKTAYIAVFRDAENRVYACVYVGSGMHTPGGCIGQPVLGLDYVRQYSADGNTAISRNQLGDIMIFKKRNGRWVKTFEGRGREVCESVWKAAGYGAQGGLEIWGNTVTFGLTDYAGYTDSKKYQGIEFEISRGVSAISRDAMLTAAGAGVVGKLAKAQRVASFVVNNATRIARVQKAGAVLMSGSSGWNLGKAGVAFAEGDVAEGIHRTGRFGMSAYFAGSMYHSAQQLGDIGRAVDAANEAYAAGQASGASRVATGVYNTETGLTGQGLTGDLAGANQASASVRIRLPSQSVHPRGIPAWNCAEPAAASGTGAFTRNSSLIIRSVFVDSGRIAGPCANCRVTFEGAVFLDRSFMPQGTETFAGFWMLLNIGSGDE